jgi:hypothetical protein
MRRRTSRDARARQLRFLVLAEKAETLRAQLKTADRLAYKALLDWLAVPWPDPPPTRKE